MNLIQRKQIVSMAMEDQIWHGRKFKEGAKEAFMAAAIWAGNNEKNFATASTAKWKNGLYL